MSLDTNSVSLFRSTLLASLVKVEYDKPFDTFQDLLDNNILLMMTKGNNFILISTTHNSL